MRTTKIIVAPCVADHAWEKGFILEVAESLMPSGTVKYAPENCRWAIGEKVFYGKHFGDKFHFEGQDLVALSENQIIGNEHNCAKDKVIVRFKAVDVEARKTIGSVKLKVDDAYDKGKYACEEAYVEASGVEWLRPGQKVAVDYLVNLDSSNNRNENGQQITVRSKSPQFLWFDNQGKREAGIDRFEINKLVHFLAVEDETRDSICYATEDQIRALINDDGSLSPCEGFVICEQPPKIIEESTTDSGIIKVAQINDTDKHGFWAKVIYGNEELPAGTEIFCEPGTDAPLTVGGKTYARIRTEYVLGTRDYEKEISDILNTFENQERLRQLLDDVAIFGRPRHTDLTPRNNRYPIN